jgi:hypothetical protein
MVDILVKEGHLFSTYLLVNFLVAGLNDNLKRSDVDHFYLSSGWLNKTF